MAAGHRSVCALAAQDFKHAHPAHDASGKGLSKRELQAYAAALPACK